MRVIGLLFVIILFLIYLVECSKRKIDVLKPDNNNKPKLKKPKLAIYSRNLLDNTYRRLSEDLKSDVNELFRARDGVISSSSLGKYTVTITKTTNQETKKINIQISINDEEVANVDIEDEIVKNDKYITLSRPYTALLESFDKNGATVSLKEYSKKPISINRLKSVFIRRSTKEYKDKKIRFFQTNSKIGTEDGKKFTVSFKQLDQNNNEIKNKEIFESLQQYPLMANGNENYYGNGNGKSLEVTLKIGGSDRTFIMKRSPFPNVKEHIYITIPNDGKKFETSYAALTKKMDEIEVENSKNDNYKINLKNALIQRRAHLMLDGIEQNPSVQKIWSNDKLYETYDSDGNVFYQTEEQKDIKDVKENYNGVIIFETRDTNGEKRLQKLDVKKNELITKKGTRTAKKKEIKVMTKAQEKAAFALIAITQISEAASPEESIFEIMVETRSKVIFDNIKPSGRTPGSDKHARSVFRLLEKDGSSTFYDIFVRKNTYPAAAKGGTKLQKLLMIDDESELNDALNAVEEMSDSTKNQSSK